MKVNRRKFILGGAVLLAGGVASAVHLLDDASEPLALSHEPDSLAGGYSEGLKDPPAIIDPRGWLDWTIHRPGPSWKTNPGTNGLHGIAFHSAEGYEQGLHDVLMGSRQASWSFSNLRDGRMLQHYNVYNRVWSSGSTYPNNFFVSVETEGRQGEPLTEAQVNNVKRLIRDLEHLTGRDALRIGAYVTVPSDVLALVEHHECSRWGSEATLCPSGRYPWSVILDGLEEDEVFYRVNGIANTDFWERNGGYVITNTVGVWATHDFPAIVPLNAKRIRIQVWTKEGNVIALDGGTGGDAGRTHLGYGIMDVFLDDAGWFSLRRVSDFGAPPATIGRIAILGAWA